MPLPRRVQHIFNKNPVSLRRIGNENVSDGADEFAVLEDGRAGHVRCSLGTTHFLPKLKYRFSISMNLLCGKHMKMWYNRITKALLNIIWR